MEETRKIKKHPYEYKWIVLRQRADGEFNQTGKIYTERQIINFYTGAINDKLSDNSSEKRHISLVFETSDLESEIKKIIENRQEQAERRQQ